MRTIIIKLKISKKQEKIILLKYPDIKFFLEKMISDTVKGIIEIAELGKTEMKEYHERQVLNANVEWEEGKPYWKNRKHTQKTKDKISKTLKAKGWKGIPLLEETKKLISLDHKGKKHTTEHRKNISIALKALNIKKLCGDRKKRN